MNSGFINIELVDNIKLILNEKDNVSKKILNKLCVCLAERWEYIIK